MTSTFIITSYALKCSLSLKMSGIRSIVIWHFLRTQSAIPIKHIHIMQYLVASSSQIIVKEKIYLVTTWVNAMTVIIKSRTAIINSSAFSSLEQIFSSTVLTSRSSYVSKFFPVAVFRYKNPVILSRAVKPQPRVPYSK